MTELDEIKKYLPLSESTCYILLCLAEGPLHGYGIMQKTEALSGGLVKIGPGTLYGAFSVLEKEGLIVMAESRDRQKRYSLTAKGRRILAAQINRLEALTRSGQAVLPFLR
ncbi:MAG TPA: helix-turn-helix transcriptional regulator [Anaerolineaceae bacterium]